jgi:hypothetical protein
MSAVSDVRSAAAALAAPSPKQAPKRAVDEATQERIQAQARAEQASQARAQLDRVQAERRTQSEPPKEKGRYVDRHA